MRSLPWRLLLTSPASESTSRCLVMACRVTSNWPLRRVTVSGPLAQRRTSRPRRVAAPRAAKSGAASFSRAGERASARDMAFDPGQLARPPGIVHAEGLVAPVRGQLVEAGLHHLEQGAIPSRLEVELHEGHGLL